MKTTVKIALPLFTAAVVAAACLLPTPGEAGNPFRFGRRQTKTATECLAEAIDDLEEELNEDGTVVAKAPDVWGEARLMKHRQEFERQLSAEIDKFSLHLNAAISRTDRAFLANALAISAALGGRTEELVAPDGTRSPQSPGNVTANISTTTTEAETPSQPGEGENASASGSTTNIDLTIPALSDGFDRIDFKSAISLEPTIRLDQLKRYIDHLHQIRRINEGGDTADAPGYALQLVRIPVSLLPGDKTRCGHGGEITVTAEPIISDKMLPVLYERLVIHDLTRAMSGPLGATLSDVEMRKQVLCLALTRDWLVLEAPQELERLEAAIAEIDEVLETAEKIKQGFVTGQTDVEKKLSALRDDLSTLQSKIKDQFGSRNFFNLAGLKEELSRGYPRSGQLLSFTRGWTDPSTSNESVKPKSGNGKATILPPPATTTSGIGTRTSFAEVVLDESSDEPNAVSRRLLSGFREWVAPYAEMAEDLPSLEEGLNSVAQFKKAVADATALIVKVEALTVTLQRLNELADIPVALVEVQPNSIIQFSDSRSTNSAGLIPFDQWSRVYGRDELSMVGLDAMDRMLGRPSYTKSEVEALDLEWLASCPRCLSSLDRGQCSVPNHRENAHDAEGCPDRESLCQYLRRAVHPLEVEHYVRTNLTAAYRLLKQPENATLWEEFSTPELVSAIRNVRRTSQGLPVPGRGIDELRNAFFARLSERGQSNWYQYENAGSFAWAVLVHATLLNERLNADARRMAVDRECGCGDGHTIYNFHIPEPGPEAAEAFRQYVKCKWPVRVFALDPVTQEQNVLDQFSMRRELQLAMALAFASGQINASNATKFVRQFELDMETIALNRTAVAFGHGESTFGWRFYPRVQTPDEEGNATVVFRDLLLGRQGKDARLRQHRIEPGMRECVALVVMPSFVPYVRFDARGNWFELTDPDDTKSSISDMVRWSKKIRRMRDLEQCSIAETDLYHDPRIVRQMRSRVQQIEKKLPLQTVDAPMPLENLPSGTTLFANGSADLAPELHYWTGAQGINRHEPTELLLKGANFSVLDTRVLVGDMVLPPRDVDLVSREIMRIRIPANVRTKRNVKSVYQTGVDVHVATPYGITSKLFVPSYVDTTTVTPPVMAWSPPNLRGIYYFEKLVDKATAIKAGPSIGGGLDDQGLQLGVPDGITPATTTTVNFDYWISTDIVTSPTASVSKRHPVENVPFNTRAKAYVLTHNQLADLHTEIRKHVFERLAATVTRTDDANADAATFEKLDVEVHIKGAPAAATFIPVSNTVRMTVKLRQLSQ